MREEQPFYSCCTHKFEDKTPQGKLKIAKKWLMDAVKLMELDYKLRDFEHEEAEDMQIIYFYLKKSKKNE